MFRKVEQGIKNTGQKVIRPAKHFEDSSRALTIIRKTQNNTRLTLLIIIILITFTYRALYKTHVTKCFT